LRITGSGGSDVENFNVYKNAKVIIQGEAEKPSLETTMKLRFRFSDRTLSILIADTNFQVITQPGDVFIVRIADDGRIGGEPSKTTERARGQLEAVDVERLLRKAKAD